MVAVIFDPLGDVVVGPHSLKESMSVPVGVQGRSDCVLVPLSESGHNPGAVGVRGALDVRGELVHEGEDPGSDRILVDAAAQ